MDLQSKKDNKELLETLHAAAAYVMAGLIVLHVGAALRHRLLLKDQVIRRMLPKFIPLLALLLALAGAPALAAEWLVDPAKSSLGFVGQQSGKSFEGRFKSWQAEISFDPEAPAAGHARVVIDMASASTGDRQRDSALPEADWFDVKKAPQAVFTATSFTAAGPGQFVAQGSLDIRGLVKPVSLPFSLEFSGDGAARTAHAKGGLDLLRTDFGVGQGEWADGSFVALKVAVVVDLIAHVKP
jgi:polyisoprenoid-binding protein YceI